MVIKEIYLTPLKFNEMFSMGRVFIPVDTLKDLPKNIGKWQSNCVWVKDALVNTTFRLRSYSGRPMTVVVCKDNDLSKAKLTNGFTAYRISCMYYKVRRPTGELRDWYKENPFSAVGFFYMNPRYDGLRVQGCYGYDINSAYSWAMLQKMPNLDEGIQGLGRCLIPGEIGLRLKGALYGNSNFSNTDLMTKPGQYADIIFKTMDSPFKPFVWNWYNKKVNSNNARDKAKAKEMLNYCIGYYQKINPYIRAVIIGWVNNRIKSLMDKNTIYCNTDSIVSMKRRQDIEQQFGKGVGQWKLEHKGSFAHKGHNHQWNLECPSYQGKPKSWFPKGWDILKDALPDQQNDYDWCIEKGKFIKNKEKKYE